jgi:hypothetical protein
MKGLRYATACSRSAFQRSASDPVVHGVESGIEITSCLLVAGGARSPPVISDSAGEGDRHTANPAGITHASNGSSPRAARRTHTKRGERGASGSQRLPVSLTIRPTVRYADRLVGSGPDPLADPCGARRRAGDRRRGLDRGEAPPSPHRRGRRLQVTSTDTDSRRAIFAALLRRCAG